MTVSRTDRAARLLDGAAPRALLRRLPTWRGLLVLNYHRVGDPTGQPWDRTLWSATAERFDEQLAVLARETDVVAIDDVERLRVDGRGRHVLITFDDGYRDNHEVAFRLLRAHRLPATFFLTTGFLDRPHAAWWDEIAWMTRNATARAVPADEWLEAPVELGEGEAAARAAATLTRVYKRLPAARTDAYVDFLAAATGAGRCPADAVAETWMTWEMARELRDGGMAIGGHTVTHPLLARLSRAEQERELSGCAERLRAELDQPMRWFSYPVGSPDAFDDQTVSLLRERQVELAFAFSGGYASGGDWDPLRIPRVHVGPLIDGVRLRAMLRLPQLFARPE